MTAVEVQPLGAVRATVLLVQRNYIVYRQAWKLFITGFFEPFFYLLSIGVGVGQLIETFEFNGRDIPYAEFVAPGMLAASAFNGALIDATFNTFFKLKYVKLYDQMLATPLTTGDVARGEIAWSQLRGSAYAAAFLVIMTAMGLVHSWWAVLAFPATILIGFASSANPAHNGDRGRPVPSRVADLAELTALLEPIQEADHGVVALLPGGVIPFDDVFELQAVPPFITGRVTTKPLLLLGYYWTDPALRHLRRTLFRNLVRPNVDRVTDVRLDLVGEDTMRGAAQDLVTQLGLGDRVAFHGAVANPDIVSLYRNAHLFVLSSRHEAAQIVALEARDKALSDDIAQHEAVIVANRKRVADAAARAVEARAWLGPFIDALPSDSEFEQALAMSRQADADAQYLLHSTADRQFRRPLCDPFAALTAALRDRLAGSALMLSAPELAPPESGSRMELVPSELVDRKLAGVEAALTRVEM